MSGSNARWAWSGGVLGVAVLCLLPFLVPDYRVFQLNLVVIYAVAILGLNILTGFSGQISLGHGAFYAIGAYTAAILTTMADVPYAITPIPAAAVCFVVGVLMGFPALRLGGHYLALATYALALAVPQLLRYRLLEPLTGGVQGIVLDKPDAPLSLSVFGRDLTPDRWLYFFGLLVAAILYLLAWNLLRGRVGRALLAIREHPTAAAAMGVNLPLYKTLAFGVSAAFTGVAGALGAISVAFVAPDSFTVFLSISLLVGSVIGGLSSIGGAVFGAIFIQFVPNIANNISESAPWAIYGLFLLTFMFLFPSGIRGMVGTLARNPLVTRMTVARARPPIQTKAPEKDHA